MATGVGRKATVYDRCWAHGTVFHSLLYKERSKTTANSRTVIYMDLHKGHDDASCGEIHSFLHVQMPPHTPHCSLCCRALERVNHYRCPSHGTAWLCCPNPASSELFLAFIKPIDYATMKDGVLLRHPWFPELYGVIPPSERYVCVNVDVSLARKAMYITDPERVHRPHSGACARDGPGSAKRQKQSLTREQRPGAALLERLRRPGQVPQAWVMELEYLVARDSNGVPNGSFD